MIELKSHYSQEEIAEFFDFPKFEKLPLRHMAQTHRLVLLKIPSAELKLQRAGIVLPTNRVTLMEDEEPYVVYSKSSDIPVIEGERSIEVGDIVITSPHFLPVTTHYNGIEFSIIYHLDCLLFLAFEDWLKIRMKNVIKKPDSMPGN